MATPCVWMWWNDIWNISKHWGQQNIIWTAEIKWFILWFFIWTNYCPLWLPTWTELKHNKVNIAWKRSVACMYNVDVMTLPQLLDIELCDVNYSVIFHIVAFQARKWEVGIIVDVNNISWIPKCSTDDPTVFLANTMNMDHLVYLLLIGICLQVNSSCILP